MTKNIPKLKLRFLRTLSKRSQMKKVLTQAMILAADSKLRVQNAITWRSVMSVAVAIQVVLVQVPAYGTPLLPQIPHNVSHIVKVRKFQSKGKLLHFWILSNLLSLSRERNWFEFFQSCEDEYKLCNTNSGATPVLDGSNLKNGLFNGGELNFSIMRIDGQSIGNDIPRNYFCKWVIDLDVSARYSLAI